MKNKQVPSYEPDDGQLTPEQIEAIRKLSGASHLTEADFKNSLFDEKE